MTLLATLFLSFCIFALITWAFMHMRTPRFRMERKDFLKGLEDVIAGQANDSEWRVLTGYPVRHDPELERIRLECLAIEEEEYTGKLPYLFSETGLARLRAVHRQLLEKSTDQTDEFSDQE